MKLSKYLLIGFAALSLVSCEKDDPTFADYVPDKGGETEDPDKPSGPEIPAGAELQKVTVDRNTAYQTIAGFGASDCWAPAFVGENWTSCRDEIATLLFDQSGTGAKVKGIGLSMWRMNLGAGSWEQGDASGIVDKSRRAESYRGATSEYDWTKCTGQRYWIEKARDFGVEKFVFFSNSPLVEYTYNGQARSDRGTGVSNLKPENYEAYANYMADVALKYKNDGYNITHISPFNEPQYDWKGNSQEGSGWSLAEQAKMVRALDKALTEKGADIDILPGEAASWEYDVMSHYFTAGDAAYIGDCAHVKNNLFGAHSYWTDKNWATMRNVRQNVANTAAQYGVDLWQTEWSMLTNDSDYNPDEFPGYAAGTEMDHSIQMSRVIHNDLTVANCTSWSYWTSMDGGTAEHKNRFILIRLIPDGGDLTEGDGKYLATTNLWVLGNYSLFVRPGYVRISHDVENENYDFFGSSYLAPDNSRIVSVYTNSTDKTFYLQDEFEGRDAVMSIKTYTTSEDKQMEPATVRVKDVVTIAPKSVVTVVYDL